MNRPVSSIRRSAVVITLAAGLAALPFSITLCHTAIILFLLLWVTEGHWKEKLATLKKNAILQIILALALLEVAGLAYTTYTAEGFFSLERKAFLFILPIAIATTIRLSRKEVHAILYTFAASCLVGVLICLAYAVATVTLPPGDAGTIIHYLNFDDYKSLNPNDSDNWLFFSYISLAQGIGIHPTFFSIYLVFCIAFLGSEIVKLPDLSRKIRLVMMAVIVLFTLFVVCLSSRIAIIGLGMIYLAAFVRSVYPATAFQRRYILPLGLLVIMFALVFVNPVSRYRGWQEMHAASFSVDTATHYQTSAEIRFSLWWLAWKSFTNVNPLIGTGNGDVTDIMEQMSMKYGVSNILNTYDPHNQYLRTLVGQGIVGFVLLVTLLGLLLYFSFIHVDDLCMAFVFVFAVLCLTECAFELQKGIAFFSLVCPLLAFQRQSFEFSLFNLKSVHVGR